MNQQPLSSRPEQFRNGANIFVFLCRALALSLEVFLHRPGSFGERYIGLQSGATFLLILFFPIFWARHNDAGPLFVFLVVYLFMTICVRARVVLRVRRGGPQPHTLYTGTPWLSVLCPRVPETKLKAGIEPVIACGAGALFLGVSEQLGCYLMLASFGLLVSTNLTAGYERKRALDMHDAFMEQRSAAERFRDLHRD